MVILHTNHGDITLELDAENAPATVENFLQYVHDGHYDNTLFHRVIDGFMVQGGGFEPGMKQKPTRAPVANEAANGAQEQALHGGDGAHVGSAFGDRAVLHQRRRQRFLDYSAERRRAGATACSARSSRAQDVVDQIKGVATGTRHAPERADRRRRHHARRGSRSIGGSAPTLFLSDLHLAPERPALVDAFDAFCAGPAREAAGVYMLGDLFDAWIGDDQLREPFAARVAAALRGVTDAGVPLYVVTGNRDFLLGERFADATGATLLPEQIVVNSRERRRCCCTATSSAPATSAYQRYRAVTRNPRLQRRFLALPVLRCAGGIADWLRRKSRAATAGKPESIIDVEPAPSSARSARAASRG